MTYVDNFAAEDDLLRGARERAADLGAHTISPAIGATLSFFARLLDAKAVVEVGTGAGVSGLWLLRGMRKDGVLTTIDTEPEHQRTARRAFAEAGVASSRARLINGRALDVLPRLADASYDLVFIDAAPVDYSRFVAEGVRLLRQGGAIALNGALNGGRVADSSYRDTNTVAIREATRLIAEDDRLASMLLPLGDGLVCAVRL